MTTISGHTTRAGGTILTAAIYNADHVNHVANAVALNASKMEGATPPVADGHVAVWEGTSGAALRTAGFIPARQTDMTTVQADLGTTWTIGRGGTGQTTAALAFAALKQNASDTATGVVEKATVAEYQAGTADKYISADLINAASVEVTLADAATIAVDWDTFICGIVTLTANRILGAPANAKPGTYRTIRVNANSGTLRTLTFAAGYRGGTVAPTDITNAKEYLITLYAVTSSICVLKMTQALP